VNNAAVHAVTAQAPLELRHAARVCGGDDFRASLPDVAHLLVEHAYRHFPLSQTVDASAAAAAVGVG